MADNVAEEILRVALKGLQLRVLLADKFNFFFHARTQVRFQADQFDHAYAVHALKEDNHIAVGHFYGLVNFSQSSDFVEVGRSRIFYARVELRNDAEKLFVTLKRIHKRQRAIAADSQRQHSSRKQDRIPDRQNRQDFWEDCFFLSHNVP